MEKRVTLRDIAEATGVHFTTVGLALRNDSRVKAATIAKVRAAARDLGYTHNAMLSALSAYRRNHQHRFAGTLAYVLNYKPEAYKGNLAETTLRSSLANYAKSQGFKLETFQITNPGMTGLQVSRILQARGIQGVLLSPRLPTPGPISDLEWGHFSTVAIGYSVTNVAAHRVCIHHAYNMRLCLRKLRERGYRRIGLVVLQDFSERSHGIMLGSYLAEQYSLLASNRVTPLIPKELTKAALGKWLKAQRVDCVIMPGYYVEIYDWIKKLGYNVPNEIGIGLISRFGKSEDMAGIDEQNDLLGVAAGKSIVSLLQHNEHGLPEYPLYTMVEGRWVDGPSVRPLAIAARA
ncbi:MAG: LacI family DNA-binding transcriptional regulator [Opitutaceae bacterium]|nr:LacI family DNA-binding transcriptional regulator [Opitutaceae bacterium]